ncbi:MAG: methyltransferase domain-containing protein [Methyloceanibacter sp.]
MPEPDSYLLGRSLPEEERLKRQIADLAPDSDAQLEKIGIKSGEKIVDIGCGPGGVLHLLAKRVGPTGAILGIDRSAHFVEQARRFAADLGLMQVEVREGDAYDTGLPRASFDGAHMRLVLVNVPKPELIVREVVSLVKPGGWVASFEAEEARVIDPLPPEYTRLRAAYEAHARSQGIDLDIGRRTHRLFREAGLIDIHVDAVVHVYPVGHSRRPIFRDFIDNVRDKLIDGGFISRPELESDLALFEEKLADSAVLMTSVLHFLLRGRVPAGRKTSAREKAPRPRGIERGALTSAIHVGPGIAPVPT